MIFRALKYVFPSLPGSGNQKILEMELVDLIKIVFLCVVLWFDFVTGTTDSGDYAILDEFRKGLSNPELLRWPENDKDPCGSKWQHVFCSGPRVTQIQVQGLGLSGPLPRDFNKLKMLINIGLQRNKFSGPLPTFNGLSNLHFAYLGWNQFNSIPTDFFVGLDNLQVISLDNNPLNQSTGWTLPPDLANSAQLTNLTLMSCNLAGPLPDFLGKMPSLTVLKLSYNALTGPIPTSYGSLQLQLLWLNNQEGVGLSGSLDVIASMTMLNEVWLHGNGFSGQIPSSIGALTSLKQMWLNDNRLVGLVPDDLASLPQLTDLKLDDNMLMGSIPKLNFGDFTYNHNSFCQSTPGEPCSPEVTALLQFLQGVGYPEKLASSWTSNDPCSDWLGISCFNGKVSVINLPNFHLTGTISSSLGQLSSLSQVQLAGNDLSGTIPSELTKLNSLKLLNLSQNNISPPVPSFPSSVKVDTAGNKLLDDPGSSGSLAPTSSGSNTPKAPGSTGDPTSGEQSGTTSDSSRTHINPSVVLVIVPVAVLLISVALLLVFWYRKRRKAMAGATSSILLHPKDSSSGTNKVVNIVLTNNSIPDSERSIESSATTDTYSIGSGNLVISVQVLRSATQNFAPENVLGRGGFGVVYKGVLDSGKMIAVKRTESAVLSDKGLEEFQAEIAVLSKVRHRHLVSILGYSVEDNERLLVYEYMPKGALSRHLFDWKKHELEPLSWKKRLNIALDVARGLQYLHTLGHQSFIHRDLKPSNILLSDDFRAKIADFGLVKLAPDGKNSFATRVAGTFGYLAPEYAVTGKVSTKIDVFSFGVVLMELLTGFMALDEDRPEDSRYLATWFIHSKNTGQEKLRSIVDPSLNATEETFESICIIAELAGHCAARDPHQRPDMGHAVSVLAPLAEKWKPVKDDEEEERLGIDFGQPLLQMVKGWQESDGNTYSSTLSFGGDSKGSIPARPAGFVDSFTSTDGR